MLRSPQTEPIMRHHTRASLLDVARLVQPDDISCGPTCLAQVMRFHSDLLADPTDLGARLTRNPDGGTLAVHIGQLALDLGWHARLYPLGMRVFDPTWWSLSPTELAGKLSARAAGLPEGDAREDVEHWLRFVQCGGELCFAEPDPTLLMGILDRNRPVICGLSATWLYREARTNPFTNALDDVLGWPTGHFVTIVGYADSGARFHVVDPSPDADRVFDDTPELYCSSGRGRYLLPADRLIHSILLGDATRDAVLLEVWKPTDTPPEAP
jgi:hypothetical protein